MCPLACDNVGAEMAYAMALSAGRMMFVRAVIMKWKYAETLSITSVEFEVELHTIANTVIVESEVIFERTFTLSL